MLKLLMVYLSLVTLVGCNMTIEEVNAHDQSGVLTKARLEKMLPENADRTNMERQLKAAQKGLYWTQDRQIKVL